MRTQPGASNDRAVASPHQIASSRARAASGRVARNAALSAPAEPPYNASGRLRPRIGRPAPSPGRRPSHHRRPARSGSVSASGHDLRRDRPPARVLGKQVPKDVWNAFGGRPQGIHGGTPGSRIPGTFRAIPAGRPFAVTRRPGLAALLRGRRPARNRLTHPPVVVRVGDRRPATGDRRSARQALRGRVVAAPSRWGTAPQPVGRFRSGPVPGSVGRTGIGCYWSPSAGRPALGTCWGLRTVRSPG